MAYTFRVLGRLDVWHGDVQVSIGPPKRQALLAMLLLEANRPVSLGRLTEAVWAGSPPPSAVANVRTHAAALRRATGDRIAARGGSYEIEVRDGELDVTTFGRLATDGWQALQAGDPATALARLGAALALWRGTPTDALRCGPVLEARFAALEDDRLDVYERYVDALLAVGAHTEVQAGLREHLARQPLREKAWGQLILALYRSGVPAAALTAYDQARAVLREQMGVEPGAELAGLYRAMLDRDPRLDLAVDPPAEVPVAPTGPRAPRILPGPTVAFCGRTGESARAVAALRAAAAGTGPAAVAILGPRGIGKTALAVHAAGLVADEFPDGQVTIELDGGGGPPPSAAGIAAAILRAFGVDRSPAGGEALSGYRSLLAGRRVLILLDGAVSPTQVRPLVPGVPGSVLLVTSRRRLATLDLGARLDLPPLDDQAALQLLAAHAGAARLRADPRAARQLIVHCERSPLALRIAAARLAARPSWPVAALARETAEAPLDALQFEDLSLREAFASDYLDLAAEDVVAARAFRLLGVLPEGRAGIDEVATVLDEPDRVVFAALERLVDARLADSPGHGTYRVCGVLRRFAAELAHDDAPELVAVDCPAIERRSALHSESCMSAR